MDVAENVKPPSRGTVSFDVLVAETSEFAVADDVAAKLKVTTGVDVVTTIADALVCGFSNEADVEVATAEVGDFDVDSGNTTDAVGMDGLLTSLLASLFGFFNGSIIIDLVVSDGAFKTDVVVAVLNVTDVFVLKLADVEDTGAFDRASSDFSTLALFDPMLSTSSFDSSPRKKLNIIANLDFESRFLFKLNKLDVLAFGFTNEIPCSLSSSSSGSFRLLLTADITL